MKTQTRILDNRLYYTRKIELHRKGKKSRTVRITPILICSICCTPHLTGKCGTRPFLSGSGRRAGAYIPKNAPSAFPLLGAAQAPGDEPNPPVGDKNLGEGPLRPKEISKYQIRAADNTASRSATRHSERCRPKSLSTNNGEKCPLW